jgi:hypothetical protein
MESPVRTQEYEPATERSAPDMPTTQVHPSLTTAAGSQCSVCAATLAPDQRYCVECGTRRGAARFPSTDGLSMRPRETAVESRPVRRSRMSVNNTLIAGIGTLLLAMGIGVLIGRSGNSSTVKSPAVQVVTVPGAGAGAAASTTAGATTTPGAGGGSTPTKSGSSSTAGKSKSKQTAAPPPKAVTVGTPGHGPGYQNGKFTGNFFGP